MIDSDRLKHKKTDFNEKSAFHFYGTTYFIRLGYLEQQFR